MSETHKTFAVQRKLNVPNEQDFVQVLDQKSLNSACADKLEKFFFKFSSAGKHVFMIRQYPECCSLKVYIIVYFCLGRVFLNYGNCFPLSKLVLSRGDDFVPM